MRWHPLVRTAQLRQGEELIEAAIFDSFYMLHLVWRDIALGELSELRWMNQELYYFITDGIRPPFCPYWIMILSLATYLLVILNF